jgi:hypothetical protein
MQDSSAATGAAATAASRQPSSVDRFRFPLPLPPSLLADRRRTATACTTCGTAEGIRVLACNQALR